MGHKYLNMVEGKIDGFLNNMGGSGRWDTLAGSAIIEALGGRARDIHGAQYPYDGDKSTTFNTKGYFIFRDADLFAEYVSKFEAMHIEDSS